MLVALVMLIVPLSTARYGDFLVEEFDSGARISFGTNSVTTRDLTNAPELSPDGSRLVVSFTGELAYVDKECQVQTISREMEYASMPGGITPGDDRVLFYNGAPHYLPSEMVSREAFIAGSKDHVIEARSYDGEFLWKKVELDIGSPLVALSDETYLTVRTDYTEVGIEGFLFRIVSKDGSRIRSWQLPTIPGWGRMEPLDEKRSKFRVDGFVWPLPPDYIDHETPFLATVSVKGRRLELRLEKPVAKVYVRWSEI